jgi:hypothetical protein
MRRVAILLPMLAIATLLACGGGGGGDGSNSNLTGPTNCSAPPNGTFTATVNGAAWSACQLATVRRDSSVSGKDTVRTVSIVATGAVSGNLTYAIVLSVAKTGPWAAGTFTTGTFPALSSVIVGSSTSAGWSASFGSGSGSITLTTITNNHVTGTFTADAAPVTGGATGTLQIRNGKFDLSF